MLIYMVGGMQIEQCVRKEKFWKKTLNKLCLRHHFVHQIPLKFDSDFTRIKFFLILKQAQGKTWSWNQDVNDYKHCDIHCDHLQWKELIFLSKTIVCRNWQNNIISDDFVCNNWYWEMIQKMNKMGKSKAFLRKIFFRCCVQMLLKTRTK